MSTSKANQPQSPAATSADVVNQSAPASNTVPMKSGGRISIPEIAARLSVGRLAVYKMLEERMLPGLRLGRRWIVTRHAYEHWERTCGMRPALDLCPAQEVRVVT